MPLLQPAVELRLRLVHADFVHRPPPRVDAVLHQHLLVGRKVAQVARQHRAPYYIQAVLAEVLLLILLHQFEDEFAPLDIGRGPDEALAPHLLQQRLQLYLQGHPGQVSGGAAEGRPRRLGHVVQGAVQQVDIIYMQANAAAL